MNRRRSKIFRSGSGLVVVIPKDWAEGMDVSAGDEVQMAYDGKIEIAVLRKTKAVP